MNNPLHGGQGRTPQDLQDSALPGAMLLALFAGALLWIVVYKIVAWLA